MSVEIWTVGHSTRPLEAFVGLLRGFGIGLVADVRRFPGSRRNPQFGREPLEVGLALAGIGYRQFPELGGRRGRRSPGSPNGGWRVESFNAYADHMASAEFGEALGSLMVAAESSRTAIMCSEVLPWRCHRRLIADALLTRGWTAWDIMGPGKVVPHTLTPFARVEGGRLTYPAPSPAPEEALKPD